jgi:hypothetical protein
MEIEELKKEKHTYIKGYNFKLIELEFGAMCRRGCSTAQTIAIIEFMDPVICIAQSTQAKAVYMYAKSAALSKPKQQKIMLALGAPPSHPS